MADGDDWRRQMAEELARRQPQPAGGLVREWPEPRPQSRILQDPAARPAAPASRPMLAATPDPRLRMWQAIAGGLALVVAVLVGWLARDLIRPEAPALRERAVLARAEPPTDPSVLPAPMPADVPVRTPQIAPTAWPPAPDATRPASQPQAGAAPTVATTSGAGTAVVASTPPPRPAAAALNCARSGALVFQMICNDPALAVQDQRLALLYDRAMAKARTDRDLARQIDRDQASFYNGRNRCPDAACLAGLYDARIARLTNYVG